MMYDLVVIGELNADLIIQGGGAPVYGQVEQLVDDATLTVGSSSAIFACAAARLGLKVAFIGKVGADQFGRFMLRELNRRGIDTRGVVIDPKIKTGLSVILSRGNDRAILTYSGSISALRYNEVDQSLFLQARHLHLGSYFMLDALRPNIPMLFAEARRLGLSTSLDTNYDPTEVWNDGLVDLLPSVDIFLPNEKEILSITHTQDLTAAVDVLSTTVSTLAVKLGERGALARRGEEAAAAQSYPIQVVDTTGAGDTFDAGFIYGVLAGWDLQRSLQLGCACGALSTRAAGGVDAQPALKEALELALTGQL